MPSQPEKEGLLLRSSWHVEAFKYLDVVIYLGWGNLVETLVCMSSPHSDLSVCLSDKPLMEDSEGPGSPPPYKMIQTIGLSVGAAVAYIIAVLGLMFYCKKRCKAKRLQKQPEGEEPEMECLNGGFPCKGRSLRWSASLVGSPVRGGARGGVPHWWVPL